MEFKIGKLSAETGVNVDTIRYYERQGLLQPTHRKRSGYRIYNDNSIKELTFIERAKDLGFSLGEIKQLLEFDYLGNSYQDVMFLIRHKSKEIGQRLADIAAIKRTLDFMQAHTNPVREYNGCSFLDSLFDQSDLKASLLNLCTHTYLLEPAEWKFTGTVQKYGADAIGITGKQTVTHEDKIWNILREITFDEPGETTGIFNIHMPIVTSESEIVRCVANCSTFGDVTGKIAFAGDCIFLNYEMTDVGYDSCEHARMLSADRYEVTGIISGEDHAILKWQYEMTK